MAFISCILQSRVPGRPLSYGDSVTLGVTVGLFEMGVSHLENSPWAPPKASKNPPRDPPIMGVSHSKSENFDPPHSGGEHQNFPGRKSPRDSPHSGGEPIFFRLRRQKSIGFQNFRRASRVKSLQFTLRILKKIRASRGKVLKSRFTLEISTKNLA